MAPIYISSMTLPFSLFSACMAIFACMPFGYLNLTLLYIYIYTGRKQVVLTPLTTHNPAKANSPKFQENVFEIFLCFLRYRLPIFTLVTNYMSRSAFA
jgi:hypothetical protein